MFNMLFCSGLAYIMTYALCPFTIVLYSVLLFYSGEIQHTVGMYTSVAEMKVDSI